MAMISESQNGFNDHLKDNAYKNEFSLLFHLYILIEVENSKILIWKNTDVEK